MRHLLDFIPALFEGLKQDPICPREPRIPSVICHVATVVGSSRAAEAGPLVRTLGTVAVDAANLAAATTAEETVTFPGAAVGNLVTANPKTTVTTGIMIGQWFVKAAGILAYTVANVTTASVNATALTFDVQLQSL